MKELNTYHEHSEDPKFPDSLRVNPFTVPENYFRETQSVLISTLRLDSTKSSNPFSIPDNYFEILNQQIKVQTALPLSTETNGMEVPDRYFEELSSRISAQLTEAKWKEIVPETGFTIPQGYFEQAEEQLTGQINMEMLGASLKQNAFDVESNYFDELPSRILGKIKGENNAVVQPKTLDNVRKMGRTTQRWTRILAAASVIAILSLGVFFGLNQNAPTAQPVAVSQEVSLEDIPDEELANYLAMNNDGLDYLVEYITLDDTERDELSVTDFPDQDLEEYIKLMLE